MAWKTTILLITVALMGAMASAEEEDCQKEYDAEAAEAHAAYDEAVAEADAERQEVHDDPDADAQERAEADHEHAEAVAEAAEERDEALADAAEERDACLAEEAEEEREEAEDDLPPPARIEGRNVQVDVTATGLANYSVHGRVVLLSVQGGSPWEEYEHHGASHEIEGEDQEARVIDSAAGNLRFEADHVVVVPGPGLAFTDTGSKRGHGDSRFLLEGDGFRAIVNGDDLSLHNGTLVGEEFRLVVPQGRSPAVEDAVAGGQIVGEVKVDGDAEATALGPVNISSEKSGGEVLVTIEGHGEGRTLLFDLKHGALGPIEDLEVYFDGHLIEPADDLEDVLNVTDGGSEYVIVVGKERTQLLVQIPHFSVHEIRLQGSVVDVLHEPPVLAIALGALAAVVLVAVTQRRRT